jgi:peptidoglycan hydrolase CwlO-like protein
LANKKEFHGRQQGRLINQREFLKKITEDLADMQEKLNTAWTETFKERMAEKVAQKELKISEVQKDIAEVTGKLTEVEKDIADITEKIASVDKSNEELKLKIEEVKKNLEQ